MYADSEEISLNEEPGLKDHPPSLRSVIKSIYYIDIIDIVDFVVNLFCNSPHMDALPRTAGADSARGRSESSSLQPPFTSLLNQSLKFSNMWTSRRVAPIRLCTK